MKPEYHEGQEALDRFNKLGTAVFRSPKTIVKDAPEPPKHKPKKRSKE